jgi:hypothetical protein
MELDELKSRWAGLDAKLDAVLRLDRRLLADRILDRADRAMARHAWALAAELAAGVVAVLLTGSFVAGHLGEPRFLAPGLLLHAFVIAQIGALVAQIVGTRRIDYAAPLVEIQRRIAAVRVAAIRTTTWTLLVSPLLWTPLLVVALRGLFGVDAYAALGASYLAANVAFGFFVIAAGLFVSRRYADRLAGSPFARRVTGALAGASLAAATGFLEELARFEREDAA